MTGGVQGPNLQELKAAAEAVPEKAWEVWPNVHGYPVVIEAGGRGAFAEICRVSTRFDDYGRSVNAFIAAADPATVLDLIGRLEAAWSRLPGQQCLCGEILAGTAEQCGLHPDVRRRTVRERIDFEQAFDKALERSRSSGSALHNPGENL